MHVLSAPFVGVILRVKPSLVSGCDNTTTGVVTFGSQALKPARHV